MELHPDDLEAVRRAKWLLEKPSLAVRLADTIGSPIERGFGLLPEKWISVVHKAVNESLTKALSVAVRSLQPEAGGRTRARTGAHRLAVAVTGAAGGAFGIAGLAFELPVSTVLMLRSIAEIARSEEEDLSQLESRLACLEVFALGGGGSADDAAETGYLAIRAALAKSVSEAVKYVAERGIVETGSPALVRLITSVGARFGVAVSEKIAAMAVPVLGAAGGAVINSVFISHFQDVARGHFIIRRLERRYGAQPIQQIYLETQLPASGERSPQHRASPSGA